LADTRFILGQVAPISVTMMGAVCFQFERELACAPDCSPAPGFADGKRTVVREMVLRIEIESKGETQDYDATLAERANGVRLHEDGHVLDRYHGTVGLLSSRQFYPTFVEPRYWPVLRDDICRFMIVPRSLEDMTQFMQRFFGSWITAKADGGTLRGSAANIIAQLVAEGRIEHVADDRFRCPLYDEGRSWEIH
jgi:hypothetical protein